MNNAAAWFLILTGLLISGMGLLWLWTPTGLGLGKLPGDIRIERENFRFYLPITSCILVSLLLSGLLWLFRRLHGS
jgi:hypothetical protein